MGGFSDTVHILTGVIYHKDSMVMVRIVTTKGPYCMLSVCSPRVCASSLQVLLPTL